MALLHELIHVVRNDFAIRVVSELFCAVVWFQPLAWTVRRKLREEQEFACDEWVLAAGRKGSVYAKMLLDWHDRLIPQGDVLAPGMAQPKSLERRLRAILAPQSPRTPLRHSQLAGCWIASLGIVLPLWSVQFTAAAPSVGGTTPAVSERRDSVSPTQAPVASYAGADGAEYPERFTPSTRGHFDQIPGEGDRWFATWSRFGRVTEENAFREIRFQPDLSDISYVEPGGFFELYEKASDGTRRLVVSPAGDGQVRRAWYVDGHTADLDQKGRAWIANRLLELERHAGYVSRMRVAFILGTGGVETLIDELTHLDSDGVRRLYVLAVLKQDNLPEAQKEQVLLKAGERFATRERWSKLLSELLEDHGMSARVRNEVVRQVQLNPK